MSNTNNKTGGIGTPFMAFSADSDSIAVLKQFATAHGWAEDIIHTGDIDTAAEFLKSNHSPKVLFIDVTTTADKVAASLDALADVCEPGVKVIVSGKINEYSFYCWLVDTGISNYLLKPFKLPALEAAYQKALEISTLTAAVPEETKKDANVITVIGSRGGVGATTVCVNMAWILLTG